MILEKNSAFEPCESYSFPENWAIKPELRGVFIGELVVRTKSEKTFVPKEFSKKCYDYNFVISRKDWGPSKIRDRAWVIRPSTLAFF